MFYCEECRVKQDWPKSFTMSHGKCEMCDTVTGCYDRPSGSLPKAKIEQAPAKIVLDPDYPIKPEDLKVDTFRRPGQGGFGNTVEPCVRITHLPSGIAISESDDRSTHRNRAEAMRKLQVVANHMPQLFEPKAAEDISPQDIMRFHTDMMELIRDGQRYRKLKGMLLTGVAAEISMGLAELYGGRSDPGRQVLLRVYTGLHDTIGTYQGPNLDILIDMAPPPNPKPKDPS